MQNIKNENKAISLTVTEGLTVTILPSLDHDFLMSTKQVAEGYGVTEYAIRQNKVSIASELIEGKHFVKGVRNTHTLCNAQPNKVFWTKRGIIRLGFAMRSERAKLFRNWAEELIIKIDEMTALPMPIKALPKKRNHNRLTSERLIRLLQLTHRIDDADLRTEIVEQLMGGGSHE